MNLSGLKIKLKVNSMFIFYYPEYKTNTDLPTVTLSLYTKNFKEKKNWGRLNSQKLIKGMTRTKSDVNRNKHI